MLEDLVLLGKVIFLITSPVIVWAIAANCGHLIKRGDD
jgi:hypothetical protein